MSLFLNPLDETEEFAKACGCSELLFKWGSVQPGGSSVDQVVEHLDHRCAGIKPRCVLKRKDLFGSSHETVTVSMVRPIVEAHVQQKRHHSQSAQPAKYVAKIGSRPECGPRGTQAHCPPFRSMVGPRAARAGVSAYNDGLAEGHGHLACNRSTA